MTRPPAASPSATPSGPNSTASTSGVSLTQHTTTSAARAASAAVGGLGARPARAGPAPGPGVRFQPVTGNPARREVGGHRRPHRPEPHERDPLHRRPPAAWRRAYRPAARRRARTIRAMEWLGVDRRRLGTGMLVFGLAGMVIAGDRGRGAGHAARSRRATSTSGSRRTRRGSRPSLDAAVGDDGLAGDHDRQRRRRRSRPPARRSCDAELILAAASDAARVVAVLGAGHLDPGQPAVRDGLPADGDLAATVGRSRAGPRRWPRTSTRTRSTWTRWPDRIERPEDAESTTWPSRVGGFDRIGELVGAADRRDRARGAADRVGRGRPARSARGPGGACAGAWPAEPAIA